MAEDTVSPLGIAPDSSSRGHRRTDSEAMTDLETVFRTFDLDGQGELDLGSFTTALLALDVILSDADINTIFNKLDTENHGKIPYDHLLEYLKQRKDDDTLSGTIFNAVRNSSAPRMSVGNQMVESPVKPQSPQIDPKKKKMIQRAVIVIKKAVMKNIGREEVIEFLVDKGMTENEIELAYTTAQEQVLSPDEKLRYLQGLAESRAQELSDSNRHKAYLTSELSTSNRTVQSLKDTISLTLNVLHDTFPAVYDAMPDATSLEELQNLRVNINGHFEDSKRGNDAKSARIHEKDLQILNKIMDYVENKRYFHAYIAMQTLDALHLGHCPSLLLFLETHAKSVVK